MVPRKPNMQKAKLCACILMACVTATVIVIYYDEVIVFRSHHYYTTTPRRVVVSLSTFGPRLRYLLRSLPSILHRQTLKADRIIISMPRFSRAGETNISEAMSVIRQVCGSECDRVHLHLLDTDPGPVAKIAGALELETHPDTYIITVDDDIEYGPLLLATLVAHASEQASVGFECVEPRAFDHRHVSTGKWFLFPFDHGMVQCYGWLEGVHGIIYKRSFFGEDFLSLQRISPRGCWFDDDVFIAGYLKAKGVERWIFPHYEKRMNAFVSEMGLALVKHPQRDLWSRQCSNGFFDSHYDAE